ncbi:MAG: serine/threonine protein kinase [Planctomycetes bacterium]|nr:serine/threonine protein kinase [Planctomycetota bacterium]
MTERVGDFVLDRPLASGGMGEVWLAHHVELGTRVAVKRMPVPVGEDAAAMRERFAREARLQAAVDHPGVVRVLDCDVAGDRPYLVLEFVAGSSLRELLNEGPVPIAEAVRLGAEVADVLAAAHARGVLHRDVKPENVMRAEDGRVRVLDFGIARARSGDSPVTRTGEIVGTPQYMAPEQVLDAGDEVDERADVHALGLLVYELLTGSNPFCGTNVFAALKLVESLVPPPPSRGRPGVPAAVDRVVLKALAKDRGARFRTAADFGTALRAAIDRPARPRTWAPYAVLTLIVALVALSLRGFGDGSREDGGPDRAVAAPPPASRFAIGQAKLLAGEFHGAIADLEFATGAEARSFARLAWLCAYRAEPLVADLPPDWSQCDEVRRARLFGGDSETEAAAADDPELVAARALSRGDAAMAWELLRPLAEAEDPAPPPRVVAVALIAAHCACGDRRVLRAVHARFDRAHSELAAMLELRFRPRRERIEPLRSAARRLPIDGPDHWLVELLVANLARDAEPTQALHAAEMAWLQGGGEVGVVWLAAARLAARAGGTGTDGGDTDARVVRLLGQCRERDVPIAVRLCARLTATGELLPLARDPFLFDSAADAATALRVAAVPLDSFEAMALQLRAGAEPDPATEPWSALGPDGPLHRRWLEEVCGGVR